jgi:hypothetical protein
MSGRMAFGGVSRSVRIQLDLADLPGVENSSVCRCGKAAEEFCRIGTTIAALPRPSTLRLP